MPGGDRSGPLGQGPRTGRATGYCAGYEVPGYMSARPNDGFGGFGRGRGHGGGRRGWRHQFYATGLSGWQRADRAPAPSAPPSHEVELKMLETDLQCLEQRAAELRRWIEQLHASAEETRED